MLDRLSEIQTFRFDDPEVYNGDVTIPVGVKYTDRYGGTWRNHYLTKAKLEALKRAAEVGIEAIEEVQDG